MIVRAGRLGQKTGAGWYDYSPEDRQPQPSDTVNALLAPLIINSLNPAPEEIAAQLITAMADEGQRILDEGIAQGPEDIDLVLVHGEKAEARKRAPSRCHCAKVTTERASSPRLSVSNPSLI